MPPRRNTCTMVSWPLAAAFASPEKNRAGPAAPTVAAAQQPFRNSRRSSSILVMVASSTAQEFGGHEDQRHQAAQPLVVVVVLEVARRAAVAVLEHGRGRVPVLGHERAQRRQALGPGQVAQDLPAPEIDDAVRGPLVGGDVLAGGLED